MKQYCSIIIFLFLISCGRNKEYDFLSIPSKPIYGSYFNKEIMSGELARLFSLDCGILMFQLSQLPHEPVCQILDEKTGERVGSFGSRGQGPEEFGASDFIGKSEDEDTLYCLNMPSTIMMYVREEKGADYRFLETKQVKIKGNYFTTNVCHLSNGYNIATTLSGGKEFFILLDREFNEIRRFGHHPVQGMTAEANDFMRLQGDMVSFKNSFYFATRFFSYLCRYDISDSGKVTFKWEKMLVEPSCNVYEANISIRGNEHLDGFYGLTADDEYVFVTYSGEIYNGFLKEYSACTPKTLVGFSSDGELIGKYSLEHKSMNVLLSKDKTRLYLLNYEPEFTLEIFKMDDILNVK